MEELQKSGVGRDQEFTLGPIKVRNLLNMQVELMSRQSDKGMWSSGNVPG